MCVGVSPSNKAIVKNVCWRMQMERQNYPTSGHFLLKDKRSTVCSHWFVSTCHFSQFLWRPNIIPKHTTRWHCNRPLNKIRRLYFLIVWFQRKSVGLQGYKLNRTLLYTRSLTPNLTISLSKGFSIKVVTHGRSRWSSGASSLATSCSPPWLSSEAWRCWPLILEQPLDRSQIPIIGFKKR